MAMVPAVAGGGALDNPFKRRDVAEWSRLDRLTGMLERTRVETDQWAVSRGSHTGNYNKVVNSRARNAADGSLQQRQKKQLEVFQAQGPSGSLQVIRTQSITSTSSGKASSWLPSSSPAFENLQLTLNPLDLSSQKTKASVGRSGSIGSRRPPSRPRSLVDRAINEEETDNRLSGVSRVCQQIHDDAKKRHGLEDFELEVTPHKIELPHEDSDDSGSFRRSITERRSFRSSTSKSNSASSFNGFPHETVNRKKSSSTEDLQEEVDEWRRSSKVRRSLQLSPRSSVAAEDLPPKGSVQKLKQELEGRRRLDLKSLRGHEAFENILKRGEDIINSEALGFSVVGEKHCDSSSKKSSLPGSTRHSFVTVESLKEVRERLRRTGSPVGDSNKDSEEPDDGIVTEEFQRVENEEKMEEVPVSRVKSYVYGMETQTKSNREIIRKPPQGTGSLESRTSNRSSSSGGSRTEEWYNRRKSYGFEQVHGGQTPEQPSLTNLKEKNRVESSTDSGICRSTEAVSLPPWHRASPPKVKSDDVVAKHMQKSHKISHNSLNGIHASDDKTFEGRKTVVTLGMETAKQDDVLFILEPVTEKTRNECNAGLKKTTDGSKGVQALIDNLMARENRRTSQPVTITIPITTDETMKEKGIVDNKRQYFQQLSSGGNSRNWKRTPIALNGHDDSLKIKQWKDGEVSHHTENEMKRHSIAVDDSKYVRDSITKYDIENGYSSGVEQSVVKSLTSRSPDFAKSRAHLNFASSSSREPVGPGIRVSFTNNTAENKVNEDDDDSDQTLMGKKTKRVEFCKTEVHFAAEPGRFNIVETDEKPPPTNMFRRRRRSNPIPDQSKSGLPEIRFGDSLYEKSLLTGTDVPEQIHVPDVPRSIQSHRQVFEENVEKEGSVFTESNATIFPPEEAEQFDQVNDDQDNLADTLPRGILKNRKPRPFHLGEEGDTLANEEHNSCGKWGMHLGSSQDREEEPQVPWRSSVMLRQSADALGSEETELQKLLRSLRPASQRIAGDETQDKKSGSEVKVSVADRIRQVEGKGYSTKVNFGIGEVTVVEEPLEDKEKSKPSWLYKEDSIRQDSYEDKGLIIRIGKDNRQKLKNIKVPSDSPTKLNVDDHTKKTSTTITIDLTPPPSADENHCALFGSSKVRTHLKCTTTSEKPEVLQSPSLIMKTINKPFTQVQKLSQQFEEKSIKNPKFCIGQSVGVKNVAVLSERNKDSPKKYSTIKACSSEESSANKNSRNNTSEENTMGVSCQLAALRELYNQSDDSEQADEEVRSIMSGGGDEIPDKEEYDEASVVSGSWSRVRGIRNVRHQFRKFNWACTEKDAATNINQPHQVSVATAVLPSYKDTDRLRLVETLVSTRSGRPKITSISLRYDSDQPTSQSNRNDSIKLESLSQCNEAILQSPRCQDAFMQTDIPTENQSTRNKKEKLCSSSSVFSENVYMGHPKTIKLSSVKKFSSPQPAKGHLTTEEKRSSLPRNTKNDQHLFQPQTPEFSTAREYENVPLPFVERKDDESDHDYEEIMPLPISQVPLTMTKALESCSSNAYSRGDKRMSVTKSTHSSSRRISPCREACDAIKPIRSSSTSRTSRTTVPHGGFDRKRSPSPLPSSQRQSQRSSSVQRNDERKSRWAKEETHVRHRSTSGGRHEAKKTPSEQLLEEEMLASESRVYQSAEACRQISTGKDTETSILEELTRAADQILQAVNGYTDEESRRASSDDDENDFRRKRGKKVGQVRRPSAVLGTISEGQAIKKKPEARVRPEPVRTRTSRLGPTSSTSSVESFTKEIRKASTAQARSLLKKEKANSLEGRGRTARLLQRATSRELLLSHGSSSEDITAGENAIRRQRVPRKSRTGTTTGSGTNKKENIIQQSVKGRKEPTESSRSREKSSAVTKPTGQATRKSTDINSSTTRAISSRLHSSRSREEVPRHGRTSTHGVPSMRSAARERSERREVESRHVERTCGVAEKKKTASDSGSSGKPKSKPLKY